MRVSTREVPMSLVRSVLSPASIALGLVALSALWLPVSGCATEDQASPSADGESREEVIEVSTDLEVEDVSAALRDVRAAAEDLDGHVESSALTEHASLRLRVPVDALVALRTELDELDPDRTERESRLDVTGTHADLGARLRSARATEERLLALIAERTATLADVLAAERELARVRTEIERAEAEEHLLVDRVAYASIDVTLRHHAPAWRDEPIAAMGRAFSGGLETAWSMLVALGVIGAALAPTLVLLAIAVLAFRTMWRGFARRSAHR